jgi:hypothetical protein
MTTIFFLPSNRWRETGENKGSSGEQYDRSLAGRGHQCSLKMVHDSFPFTVLPGVLPDLQDVLQRPCQFVALAEKWHS